MKPRLSTSRPLRRERRHPRGECKSLALLIALLLAAVGAMPLPSAAASRSALQSGRDIYRAGCVNCHGATGEGAERSQLRFEPPETFPDFTRCDQTTVESDRTWAAIIRDGGQARGFSSIMPAFGDALTAQQIAAVVGYLRSFCVERGFPSGELNLPKALVTEKAYPEDELVWNGAVNMRSPALHEGELAFEHRLGKVSQLELAVPYTFHSSDQGRSSSGVGDVAVAFKRVVFADYSQVEGRGQILSLQGEVSLPTGSEPHGLGAGQSVWSVSTNYGALAANGLFLQIQAGADIPSKAGASSAFLRIASGRTMAAKEGYGRAFTPILEVLADRDLSRDGITRWDLLPEMQVTLSARQHVRLGAGYRLPIARKDDPPRQFLFYVLWDWFDGGLTDGW
jgi:mono/diheme cytochrome c family protein